MISLRENSIGYFIIIGDHKESKTNYYETF